MSSRLLFINPKITFGIVDKGRCHLVWLASVPHAICPMWSLFSLWLLPAPSLSKNHHHAIKPIKTNFSKILISWLSYSNLWLLSEARDKTFWLTGGGMFIQSVRFIHYGYWFLIFMPCQWHTLFEINKYNTYHQCVKLKKKKRLFP